MTLEQQVEAMMQRLEAFKLQARELAQEMGELSACCTSIARRAEAEGMKEAAELSALAKQVEAATGEVIANFTRAVGL